MTPLEILEAHTVKRPWSEASRMRCKCGEVVTAETENQLYALHRAHVAQVLDEAMREAKAVAWDEGAAKGWRCSTPQVNGTNYHWRSSGKPDNPHRKEPNDD